MESISETQLQYKNKKKNIKQSLLLAVRPFGLSCCVEWTDSLVGINVSCSRQWLLEMRLSVFQSLQLQIPILIPIRFSQSTGIGSDRFGRATTGAVYRRQDKIEHPMLTAYRIRYRNHLQSQEEKPKLIWLDHLPPCGGGPHWVSHPLDQVLLFSCPSVCCSCVHSNGIFLPVSRVNGSAISAYPCI